MPNQLYSSNLSSPSVKVEYDDNDMDTSENPVQIKTEYPDTDSQNSPLDLSINSIRFPSANRPASGEESLPKTPVTKPSHVYGSHMSNKSFYPQPEIVTPPKEEWHYRSIKDLAKKHIPYIAGEGPQRTPIRIRIPQRPSQQMYLAVTVRTVDGQFHDSKVVVPPRTTVRAEKLTHENNLECLNFDGCNVTDHFDIESRTIYFKISEEEHRAQLKEVRVHMFNLYQNHIITKERIESKQLDLCQLMFWLCIMENGRPVPISEPSFSETIREKKTNTRSNVLQPMGNHTLFCRTDYNESPDHCSSDSMTDDSDRFRS